MTNGDVGLRRNKWLKACCGAFLFSQSTTVLAFSTKTASLQSRTVVATSGVWRPYRWINQERSKAGKICFEEPSPHCDFLTNTASKRTRTSPLFLQRKADPQDPSRQTKLKLILAHWKARIISALKWGERKIVIALFCLMMVFGLTSGEALAKGTMGRSGGSFKSAPRAPTPSRVYSSPPRSSHYSSPRVIVRPPSTQLYYRNPTPRPIIIGPNQPYGPQIRRGFRASDMILVTGSGLALAYAVSTKLEQERTQNSSALGPGFSVAKLTVALNVPDRDAPNSILRKLQQLSSMAQTITRRGVQDLVSSVALELLRQERSIRSAASTSEHFKHEGETERSFFRQSIQERSKFDDEKEYKQGNMQAAQQRQKEDSTATEAVVTILVAIEGDSTQLRPIKSRNDVLDALNRLAVDAQMEDCLLSGEIYWAPELRSESLSLDDIYVDYPTLIPL